MSEPVNVLQFLALVVAVTISAGFGYIAAGYIPFISPIFAAVTVSFGAGVLSLDDVIYNSVPIPERIEENPLTIKAWKFAVIATPLFLAAVTIARWLLGPV